MNDETPVREDLSLRDPAPQHDRQVKSMPQNMSLRSESFHVNCPKWATVDAWTTPIGLIRSHCATLICKLLLHGVTDYKSTVGVIQKKRIGGVPPPNPSFGMTTTKILKGTFLQHMSRDRQVSMMELLLVAVMNSTLEHSLTLTWIALNKFSKWSMNIWLTM